VSACVLALVVRLLPGRRREWGSAMLAEHAALEGGRARFVLGCARAVLTDRGALRTLGLHACALGLGAVAVGIYAAFPALAPDIATA
jgi:hypothetical protein